MLLVPEQQLVRSEGMMADAVAALPRTNADTQQVEVLSFRRLCERVFREAGGLCYNYIGKGARVLVMRRVLESVAHLLKQYSGAADLPRAKEFSALCTNMTRSGVNGSDLSTEIRRLREQGNGTLADKLHDISLVQDAFRGAIVADYDDPEDDLTRLTATLATYNFFGDRHVLLESFAGFTGQEFQVISAIMAQAAGVSFFWGREESDRRHVLGKLHKTEERVREIAAQLGQNIAIVSLPTETHSRHPHLQLLCDNMWAEQGGRERVQASEAINILECTSIAEEAHATAVAITKSVMAGGRYSDHVVTMRTWGDYAGVLDNTLRSFGIPFFVSQRAPLSGRAAVRVILSALQIARGGWRGEDVLAYAKTGLTHLTEREVFTLEQYTRTWKISGAMWREDWHMNPLGYRVPRSQEEEEENREKLDHLNDLRRRLVAPVVKFCEDFGQRVRGQSEAVYALLCDLEVPQKLEEASHLESGAASQESAQIWNYICDALDQLVTVAGDMTTDAAEYAAMLALLINEADIGRIPTSVDQVVVADALLLRAYDKKYVYVLGAAEGMFPKKTETPSLLTRGELDALADVGIDLAPNPVDTMAEECFLFLAAAGIATDALTVSYPTKNTAGEQLDPSLILEAMGDVFPELPTAKWNEFAPIDKAYGPSAVALLAKGGAVPAVSDDNIGEAAREQYKGDMRLSHSRLDAFARCPRLHACRYPLGLKTPQYEQSPALVAGEIMHYLLEDFFRNSPTAPPAYAMGECADRFCRMVTGVSMNQARTRHVALYQLLRRQANAAAIVVRDIGEELANSPFAPAAFELAFGTKNNSLPPVSIPLSDGTNAVLSGVLDRVDVAITEGQAFVRICDYKSSEQGFSQKDMEHHGLSLQLPLYLHALQGNKRELAQFLKLPPNSEVTPVGALYYTAKRPTATVPWGLSEADIWTEAQKKFTRHGIFLAGFEPMGAKKANILPADGIGDILATFATAVARIADGIKSGDAAAKPIEHTTIKPCEHCDFRMMCERKRL